MIQVLDAEGNVLAETKQGNAAVDPHAGAPLPIPDAAVTINILTSKPVKGAPAT